jgi:putative transposase
MKASRGLTVRRMNQLGRVSRAGFYRFDENANRGEDEDMALRDAIQRIALEWPSYGRPRITPELRRRGWKANPKRVYRILREDNLLCIRKRKFIVTTDSNHGRKIYPNLAHTMVLTGLDQLWVADITYIRLREEFVFLAVVLDAFSRRVIGWALNRTLEDHLTLAALRMALSHRSLKPELVHHSDRGSQYASSGYTELLKENGIGVSMSRQGNPWDTTPSRLGALLRNVLYIGQIRHKGVIHPGEQPAILDWELWSRVQQQVKLQPDTRARHSKLHARLSIFLYCAQCGARSRVSFTSRHGRRHLYYVCRTGKRRTPRCPQKPVAASDLESSLWDKLEPILGPTPSSMEIWAAVLAA